MCLRRPTTQVLTLPKEKVSGTISLRSSSLRCACRGRERHSTYQSACTRGTCWLGKYWKRKYRWRGYPKRIEEFPWCRVSWTTQTECKPKELAQHNRRNWRPTNPLRYFLPLLSKNLRPRRGGQTYSWLRLRTWWRKEKPCRKLRTASRSGQSWRCCLGSTPTNGICCNLCVVHMCRCQNSKQLYHGTERSTMKKWSRL